MVLHKIIILTKKGALRIMQNDKGIIHGMRFEVQQWFEGVESKEATSLTVCHADIADRLLVHYVLHTVNMLKLSLRGCSTPFNH